MVSSTRIINEEPIVGDLINNQTKTFGGHIKHGVRDSFFYFFSMRNEMKEKRIMKKKIYVLLF